MGNFYHLQTPKAACYSLHRSRHERGRTDHAAVMYE